MDDIEFHELGQEMLAALRETCLSDPMTMSARTGLADAEEAYACLAAFLEPRADIVNPAYRDMHLAASALFLIGTDPEAYNEMMSKLDWSDEERNLATIAGAWRAYGFLRAVGDDNDYSIDIYGEFPIVGLQSAFEHFLPTLNPRRVHELLRPYAERLVAGFLPSP
jgi:hypothetical protein